MDEEAVGLDPKKGSGETVEVVVDFVCPPGCPNKGKSPAILIRQQDEDFKRRSRDAVVVVFAMIIVGWATNAWVSKKAPTFTEYALSSVGLALLIISPIEARDLSIGILKSAAERIGGSSPSNVTLTVNHLIDKTTER